MDQVKKLLFICSQNWHRSPTAERMFSAYNNVEAKSAGTEPTARQPVTRELIEWAEWIFVMEQEHVQALEARFEHALAGKHLICLNIPDVFPAMSPQLMKLLGERVLQRIRLTE